MITTILEASKNFCVHQIRSEHEVRNGVSQKRTLIAYIDIVTHDNKQYRVYLASDENFMQRVSTLLLEEDESDEKTLVDMTLECANLIIGSAKVIAESTDVNPYVIQTPHFEKIGIFDFEYDQAKTITIDSDEFTIAIKELNA